MKTAELNIQIGEGSIVITKDNDVEFNDLSKISVNDLKYVTEEALAFIEYRDNRIQKREVPKIVPEKKVSLPKVEKPKPNDVPFVPLKEIPEFKDSKNTTINISEFMSYSIASNGNIDIHHSKYRMHIYTTVDEILRLKSMGRIEQLLTYKDYESRTSSSKITCLRMFIKGIKDVEFPNKGDVAIKEEGNVKPEESNIEDKMSERTKRLKAVAEIAKKRWQKKEE